MRAKLEAAGGVVYERTRLLGVDVHPDGAALRVSTPSSSENGGGGGGGGGGGNGAGQAVLSARLVLDCMGHQSPIVRQLRWARLVVLRAPAEA
jgi:lycopene cyclase CruP